mgnify:CR=1 FL=1
MTVPLRALLLSAGLGTRLRPLTLHLPKCLVPIAGEPLLGIWLKKLELLGCEMTLINTHYLNDQVDQFINSWVSKSMVIKTDYEPVLLGTAGTLLKNSSFFSDSTGLLIHSDNVTSTDLKELLNAHSQKPSHCLLTMLTFTSSAPQSCGIVETDERGVVQAFHEKVDNPPGNNANGAVYVFDKPFLNWLTSLDENISDFSTEVLPKLLGRIQTWKTAQPYIDIGTKEALEEAHLIFGDLDLNQ